MSEGGTDARKHGRTETDTDFHTQTTVTQTLGQHKALFRRFLCVAVRYRYGQRLGYEKRLREVDISAVPVSPQRQRLNFANHERN